MNKVQTILLCSTFIPIPAYAQVAISALPSATALAGTEVVPVVQSATTKKTAVSNIGPVIGTTPIVGGTTTRVLYDNAGVEGEYLVSGTGNVAMTTNPVFTTPNLGVPSFETLTNATGLVPSTGLAATGTPNSTTVLYGNNTWAAVGNGTGSVTNVATGACLTGGPITTTGTVSGTYLIDARTTTSEAINSNDACELVTFNNASAVAVTIAQATGGFGAGWSVDLENLGNGTVTVTPATSTVNGAPTLKIPKNTGCSLVSDGTNYQVSQCTAVVLNTPNVWTAQQAGSITTLTISTATFTPDGSNNDYKITLVHANCPCTLANPSVTPVAGVSGVIEVDQSATGSDVISTWGSDYIYAGNTSTISFSTGTSAKDFLSYYVADSTHILLSTAALNAVH